MRMAFFTDTYHPAMDGVVRSIDVFGRGLRARGHQLKVFAPAPPLPSEREPSVSYAPSIAFPAYPQYRVPIHTLSIARDAGKFRPDVIHCHAMVNMGLAARDAARHLDVPLIGTFHTLLPHATHYIMPIPSLRPWTSRRLWDYLGWFYEPFDRVLAPSRFMQAHLSEHGIPSTVLPTPVDTRKFCPSKKIMEKKKTKAPHSILFIGRIAQEKNLDFLLEMVQTKAWKRWTRELGSGLSLTIAGAGPYLPALQSKIARQKPASSIRLAGRVPDAKLIELYRSADCLIQPSKFETQGLTVLEAMACGTPAAVHGGTALSEEVEPGREGEWFGDDASGAVEALQKIAGNREHYSKAARKKAMQYSVEKCTGRLLKIYAEEIKRH